MAQHDSGNSMTTKYPIDQKFIGIEFLRFFSSLIVLLFHYRHFSYNGTVSYLNPREQPFYEYLRPFYDYGSIGVQIFWCISGFIFYSTYRISISNGLENSKSFIIKRFSRLYPLHFLTLIIVLLLQNIYFQNNNQFFVFHYNDIKHFILNLSFTSGWGFQNGYSFNQPIWSVSLELIVYFIFFIFMRLFNIIHGFLFACILAASFWLLGLYDLSLCIAYFFIGGALLLLLTARVISLTSPMGKTILPIIFALLIICAAVITIFTEWKDSQILSELIKMNLVIIVIIISILSCPLLLQFSKLGTFLGNMTYSSYLIHFPIQLIMVIIIPIIGFELDYRDPWLLLIFISITIGLSPLVYRYFELPAQAAIRRRHLLPSG